MTEQPHDTSHLLTAARTWHDAGYAVIPTHEDGGKRPFGAWRDYQHQRPTWAQVEAWLATGRYTGIGVLTGATSGGVEMIELEGPMSAAVERLQRVVAEAGKYAEIDLPDLLARVARGCVEQSAGGGLHLFIRVTDGPAHPNTKLAYALTGTGRKIIAETRGEGGFVVVAPTTGRNGHEPGTAYLFINGGSPDKTVDVTSEDRDLLHLVITLALNEDDTLTAQPEPVAHPLPAADGDSTFDDYRQRVTWRDILEPAGWTWSHAADGRDYWTRPGKHPRDGHSASTIEDGPLYNFSGNAGLPEETGLSKAQVYAHLNHAGDLSAAARALRDAGYGPTIPTPHELPAWQPDTDHPEENRPETPYERAVRIKYGELRILDDAKTLLANYKAGQAPDLDSITLDAFLQQPDDPIEYRVDGLWPMDGRVLLAAAAKTGKTTLVAANLIPAITDSRPFLGRATPAPLTPTGTIAYLNLEVAEATLRRWMRDAGIRNTDRVVIGNLRGKAAALQLGTPTGRKRLALWLATHRAEIVILDPLAPVLASLGLDENSNTDVARFFSWWAETMRDAGVRDDLVVHHTGHAGERSRGASRLLDEPDAIWTLTRDQDDDPDAPYAQLEVPRYLAAYGRDVDLPQQALAFDPSSKQLTLTGDGRTRVRASRIEAKVLAVMRDGHLRTRNAICTEIGGDRNAAWAAIGRLVDAGTLIEVGGKKLAFEVAS